MKKTDIAASITHQSLYETTVNFDWSQFLHVVYIESSLQYMRMFTVHHLGSKFYQLKKPTTFHIYLSLSTIDPIVAKYISVYQS